MDPRRRVAREAARLLYLEAEKEYKQAKEAAGRSLGLDAMPSNYDVAMELDLIADEAEGEERGEHLLQMRAEALNIMQILSAYSPRLIGSVWRGTAKKGSDIDITAYASEPEEVTARMEKAGFSIKGVEEVTTSEQGRPRRTHHITIWLKKGDEAEVVVRSPEETEEVERCDIYGDLKRGLSLPELERLMREDPLRRFVPQRRRR